MNKIWYILIMVLLVSCKTNTVAQEKTPKKNTKPKVEKPKLDDVQDQQDEQNQRIDPSTILITGAIQGVFKDSNICGKSYKASAIFKIKQVVNTGSGIVNPLSVGQEVRLGFISPKANDFENLKKEVKVDQEFSIKVMEGLCPDMGQTLYEILNFRAID